ncbi:probable secreted glycoprotein [Natronomonas pharaonis DSM 2160]|uniref:Probable secreted glycoprotein n=1 Tax=Natronomonas pharaonis (strain ATCC 35678 / DSM 2160 / CIP 103997 / JCM 8858 / NBRC 14720 / NCIMB 2260 / Gabara) TaxID=348780 RepID=A0A1U7EY12_NATPD|nr:hypothetical protein [Natronomonas pharaonis]CAI50095.1 probable secreted glycoprotein [Natronomonas pharaonis DSM 2160]
MDDRAVSNTVGIVLILGMTIAAVSALVFVGGAVLEDTRADTEQSQVESSMSQFSSKASLVGLGESDAQEFALGRITDGQVTVEPDEGHVLMYVEDAEGDRDDIGDVSLGAMVYENGDTEIAYQGGGVWERTGDHSRMVSPPEFHYRSETLTFPILNVSGAGSASGDVRGAATRGDDPRQLYPNVSKNEDFDNPLTDGTVYIEVESRYCEGWESFFRDRSQGGLDETCDEGDSDTLVVDLTASFEPAFGATVTAKQIENDGAEVDGSTREGIIAPSASDRIEQRIDDCETNGCRDDFSSTLTHGTYYTTDADDIENIDIDTTDGAVDIVVDDSDGVDGTGSIDIVDGDATVSLYVGPGGEFSMTGGSDEVNVGGEPSQFITYIHSDVPAVRMNSATYVGGIYAPNTVMEGDQGGGGGCGGGSVDVTGSVVVENFCFQNGAFTHDDDMSDIDVDIDANTVKYLHVSENRVTIDI